MIIANDATVKAGAFFPMTAQEGAAGPADRLRRIGCRSSISSIRPASFCRCRTTCFPTRTISAASFATTPSSPRPGIPQFAAIMGNCVAGGGYLPVLCDKLLMTEGSGLYLAGPALVKSAIGQEVSHEELGGAAMHAQISGTIDYREPDDDACLARLRRLAVRSADDPIHGCRFDESDRNEPCSVAGLSETRIRARRDATTRCGNGPAGDLI